MNKKIMIVEDSPTVQGMMAALLEDAGYEVVTANNGVEALEKISKGLPDLIISDVLMPDMDGFAFLKELKSNKETAGIPVFILTSRGKMVDTFEAVGVEGFIEKPCNEEDLLKKVAACLAKAAKKKSVPADPPTDPDNKISKRVLIAGNPDIVDQIELDLHRKGCEVVSVFKQEDIFSAATEQQSELIILDALIDNRPAGDAVRKVRGNHELKAVPILVYTHFDKKKLEKGESAHQKVLNIQNAKTLCLNAGANKAYEEYDRETFISSISEFL